MVQVIDVYRAVSGGCARVPQKVTEVISVMDPINHRSKPSQKMDTDRLTPVTKFMRGKDYKVMMCHVSQRAGENPGGVTFFAIPSGQNITTRKATPCG